jgi:DNA-directed RNA polymerase subunit H (RpoH/RPB5)
MDPINSSLFKLHSTARNNLIYYLKNIDYDCSSVENFSLEEIDLMINHKQLNFRVENKKTNEACYVHYYNNLYYTSGCTSLKMGGNSNLKSSTLLDIVRDVYELKGLLEKKDTLLIVTTDYSEEGIVRELKYLWEEERIFVVILKIETLQINILKHNYVPKHIRLSKEEKDELYIKYNIDNNEQLPEISRYDPVAKIILLRPGEVCKIIRYDKISFTNDFYRICVS